MTLQNCTREVGRPPKSPPFPSPPLALPPIPSPTICPQEHLGDSGGSKEGVGGVLSVSGGSRRVCGVFGGALRLQKGFGGVWGALEIGSGWEGHWVSIGGPEEVYRAWGGTTLRVLGDACGSCWGSRKESGGTLGLWGVFNGPGVCGMFWEAQQRVGGFVGTRESIVAPGRIIGRDRKSVV